MGAYIAKRILISIPVIFGIALITFILLNVIPGDPIALMMKEHISPDVVERVRAQMHLDDPAYVRFFRFLWGAVQGDFGVSYKLNRSVSTLLMDAFPNTLMLAISAAFVSWMIGIPAGILSAVKKRSFLDNSIMGFSLLGVSIPVFWAGLLFQYIFSLQLGILPVSGFSGPEYMIMPAIVLGWSAAGTIARLTRSSLLEVMRNDYIRTARAKGNWELKVIINHALKNSMLPVVTVMALQVAGLLSGAVITESIFGIPGIGRIAVNAIQNRDMPLLQGAVMFTTVLVIIGNLVADILYSILDPRIKYD
ncbi:peptide ABC transporter permease [Brevibacillus reuszeri]|uniref:Glutathione ABC transporter permease n=1 Tax=Brevibacillus reuszeri TaxID=54915 RepID=A0A0K9YUC0_9BACL|nr:ABC transporter permease [Brevibacillus reuszeri]KNB72314.1 glutathione ABC transporter permease [Brevibacillus reuszeri]MED1861039.1 ABC transporter permease [Brevibacillus reuszeri]GED72896.1 peptide ABC transporter permease [Brevibacillus reuszeri]